MKYQYKEGKLVEVGSMPFDNSVGVYLTEKELGHTISISKGELSLETDSELSTEEKAEIEAMLKPMDLTKRKVVEDEEELEEAEVPN